MDIRRISPDYAVSPQIEPEDIPAIAEAGFATVLCNRPDEEVPAELQAETLRIAAEAAGLRFATNPVTHQGLNREIIDRQMQVLDSSDGPVLAYCASGTRSSIVWSLGQVGRQETDEIIAATAKAGYDLERLRPQLEALREDEGEDDAAPEE
ncbi:TIGR01244 family sulfur transferase [Limimaricola sp. G21655-S1]|uniref:TIGR01244 family sulfur transferase n=1 Tax=Limimaricola sp. G21655-S1 TaxID=3014768 RepID=UPI0022AFB498|nr:TIGR01244 family sulfur transferase [Limimaricola sp. G21655-S1]MCZ4262023.1 TIGR01244 family sulfur transferase [Limimaricola sp. G21655-S1]